MGALLWDFIYRSPWARYSQVPPSNLAGGLGSSSQLPLKLALFLETDFKTVKDVPLIPKIRVVYNSKCFLQLMSLLARSFPAKMLLYSTPPTWAFWAPVS